MRNLLLFLLILAGVSGCKPFDKRPTVQKGTIDLSAWNFNTKKIVALDGDWEFYWKQLYTPTDFKSPSPPALTGYIAVPSSWNNQVIGNTKLSGQGFATYRLHINGTTGGLLGIRIPDAYSTYRLWINNVLVASNGVVGTDPITEVPELRPIIRTFESKPDNELVLQVSNFFQDKGGANSSMTMGTPEQIMHDRDVSEISTMFIVGMVMIMFVYHIVIFILSRNDITPFWFAVLCLFIAMRCLVTNDKLILVLIPGFSPDIAARIEYESVFGGAMLFGLFIQSLFPKDFSKIAWKGLFAMAIVESITICFFPTKLYTSWLTWYQLGAMTQICYFLFVIVKSVINKRKVAQGMLLVICVTLVVTINDILYARLVINTAFIISYSVPFLLVVQAYFIAFRIGSSLKSVERLSVELNDANIHLEQKVADRTFELEAEKKKTDDLLLNILPVETAEELKEKGHSVARSYTMVSVMFIDIAGLIHTNDPTGAVLAVGEIDHCFRAFDKIMETHGIEKIKTIGNVYLCAAGLPVPVHNHAENVVHAALEIKDFMHCRQQDQKQNNDFSFATRIGISIGPVVAGIVGTKKFAYDIWGDTVNTAARMQQHSEPGKINISGRTYEQVKHKFNCAYRGKVEAKNKGMTDMYYVE